MLSSALKPLSVWCAALGKFTASYSMCQGALSLWQLHAKIPFLSSKASTLHLACILVCRQNYSMHLCLYIYSRQTLNFASHNCIKTTLFFVVSWSCYSCIFAPGMHYDKWSPNRFFNSRRLWLRRPSPKFVPVVQSTMLNYMLWTEFLSLVLLVLQRPTWVWAWSCINSTIK